MKLYTPFMHICFIMCSKKISRLLEKRLWLSLHIMLVLYFDTRSDPLSINMSWKLPGLKCLYCNEEVHYLFNKQEIWMCLWEQRNLKSEIFILYYPVRFLQDKHYWLCFKINAFQLFSVDNFQPFQTSMLPECWSGF